MEKYKRYFRKACLFVIASVSCIACTETSTETTANENAEFTALEYFQMQQRYVQGSTEEQKYLDLALAKDPNMYQAWVEKSVSHNKRGEYALGMQYLNKGVELQPVEYLGYKGFVLLYMLRDYEKALECFIALDPLTPGLRDAPWGEDIYKLMGLAHWGRKETAVAFTHFKNSIDLTTAEDGEDWVEARTFLYAGLTASELHNYAEAKEYFDKYIQYRPESPEGYYQQAVLLHKQGKQIQEQEQWLTMALERAENGGLETHQYFELPAQVYLSDIKELQDEVRKY